MKKEKSPHILLTGGGTLGPVTPLLAVHDAWEVHNLDTKFSWIGTFHGPEKAFLQSYPAISFHPLFAPKLARHQKWKWPFIPFLLIASCVWAYVLLRKLRPDIIYTVGGYVSVPLFLVARLMGIPTWVHQLDVTPGIANKIMARLATRVTATFESSARAIGGLYIGGMVRQMHGDAERAVTHFGLDRSKPTVVVIGGGTGAIQLNEAIVAIKEDLLKSVNIIHSFGKGKKPKDVNSEPGYYATELLIDDLADAYAIADMLVVRGGLGTLLEAVAWRRPVVMVPIEGSHQEQNARIVEDEHAGVILTRMNPQMLMNAINKMMHHRLDREAMARNMGDLVPLGAERTIVDESRTILGL